jgi:hypothetical protein
MGYEDRVPEKIKSMGQRADERVALWQAIAEAFETEGAEGVEDELAGRMNDIHKKFNAVLDKLKAML